jgi:hypothetical protein
MSDKPSLFKATFEFIQDGNTNGSTSDIESLVIECEGVDASGCFYVLKSDTGWSINEPDDLKELIERINKSIIEI